VALLWQQQQQQQQQYTEALFDVRQHHMSPVTTTGCHFSLLAFNLPSYLLTLKHGL